MNPIGIMQGRLSPPSDGKMQSFPWSSWKEEFPLAKECGFQLIEWTLDQDRLYENPLMTKSGRQEIRSLIEMHDIQVWSLTGDCFMQAPFYKANGERKSTLLSDFKNIILSCSQMGIGNIVIPLVDDGRLGNSSQEKSLFEGLSEVTPLLEKLKMQISLESDFEPDRLAKFFGMLEPEFFGMTYDIGNSASLGYDAGEEVSAYGERIVNVHVKDRVKGNGTVPLGQGDANFETVFSALKKISYMGPLILEVARDDHLPEAKWAKINRTFVKNYL